MHLSERIATRTSILSALLSVEADGNIVSNDCPECHDLASWYRISVGNQSSISGQNIRTSNSLSSCAREFQFQRYSILDITRIPRNAVSRLPALFHKIDVNL